MLITVVLCCLTVIPVPVQQKPSSQNNAQQSRHDTTNSQLPATTVPNDQPSAKNEKGNGNKPQWWDKFVAWPEGVTAWALMLTLFAIVWQAYETRKSVQIARRALVSQHRPNVIVRSIKLDPSTTIYYDRRNQGVWKLEVTLMNIGGSIARIVRCDIMFQSYEDNDPGNMWASEKWDQPFTLRPGERHTLTLKPTGDEFHAHLAYIEKECQRTHARQFIWPTCHGTIIYQDGNGFERVTGFGREFDVSTLRFIPFDDPEFEYQD